MFGVEDVPVGAPRGRGAGLIGRADDDTIVGDSYAAGTVDQYMLDNNNYVGLVGYGYSPVHIYDSFWDVETSGYAEESRWDSVEGKSTWVMSLPFFYEVRGWNVQTVWLTREGAYPSLRP